MSTKIQEFISNYEKKKRRVRALVILLIRERKNPDPIRVAAIEKWLSEATDYLEHNLKKYKRFTKILGMLRNGRPPREVGSDDSGEVV